jgi:carotenoid cleavage dioxygenase
MAITRTHSILLDLNVGYDFSMLERGHRMPLRWDDARRARLGVVARHGGEPQWFEISPCFIQHIVNAYDESETAIVLDAVRYPWFLRLAPDGREFEENPLGRLHRYRIDLASGQVQEHAVAVLGIELPRINERLTGRPYRYFYAVEQPNTSEMCGIVRYDWQSAAFERYALAPGDQNSEPVFVPRRGARTEDDGWLLSCVYRHTTATSDLVVLDARDIAAGPIATVHLPTRIPAGFHGQWLDNDHEG